MDPPRASQHRRVTKHDSIFDKHRIYIGQTPGTQRSPLRRRLLDEAFPLHLEKEEKRRPERETHRRGEPREGRQAGRPRPQEKTDSSRPAFYRSSRRGTKSLSVIRELYAWLLSCSHDAPGLAKGCRPGVWANGKQADTCCKPRQ